MSSTKFTPSLVWSVPATGQLTVEAQRILRTLIDGVALVTGGPFQIPAYTVATLPTATAPGMIYVSDESGGATLAFADGTNWRRVQDRAIVS